MATVHIREADGRFDVVVTENGITTSVLGIETCNASVSIETVAKGDPEEEARPASIVPSAEHAKVLRRLYKFIQPITPHTQMTPEQAVQTIERIEREVDGMHEERRVLSSIIASAPDDEDIPF